MQLAQLIIESGNDTVVLNEIFKEEAKLDLADVLASEHPYYVSTLTG